MSDEDDIPDVPEIDDLPAFSALGNIEKVPPGRYAAEMRRVKTARAAEKARLFAPAAKSVVPPRMSGMTAGEFAQLVQSRREAVREEVLNLSIEDLLVEAYDQYQKHKWRYRRYEQRMGEQDRFERDHGRSPSLNTMHLNSMREEEKWGTEVLLRVLFPIIQERDKQKALPAAKSRSSSFLEEQLAGNVPALPSAPTNGDEQDDALMRAARGTTAFMEEEEVQERWVDQRPARVPGVPR